MARPDPGAHRRSLLALSLLAPVLGCAALAEPVSVAPSLQVVARGPQGPRAVAPGEAVAADEEIAFRATTDGPGYVYVLERVVRAGLPEAVRAVAPGAQDVLPAPLRGDLIVPRSAAWHLGDPVPEGWRSNVVGEAEYLLVRAPAPRDVTLSRPMPSVETFLSPPPWIEGPLAGPGEVVARTTLRW
jgi:hypothetical protein